MSYIYKDKMKDTVQKAKKQMIAGVALLVLGIFGCTAVKAPEGEGTSYLFIYVFFMLVPGILLVLLSIRNRRINELVRRLNQLFSADSDGVIDNADLMRITGIRQPERAVKKIDWLIGKGYIAGCTVSYDQGARVILTRRGENVVDFKTIVCPDCGAKTEVRVGFTNRCQHCGRIIDAKSVDDKQ